MSATMQHLSGKDRQQDSVGNPHQAEKPKEQKTKVDDAAQRDLRREYDNKMKQFGKLEAAAGKLSDEKKALEAKLASPEVYANAGEFQKLDAEYRAVEQKWKAANADYEKMMEEVMELEEKLS